MIADQRCFSQGPLHAISSKSNGRNGETLDQHRETNVHTVWQSGNKEFQNVEDLGCLSEAIAHCQCTLK